MNIRRLLRRLPAGDHVKALGKRLPPIAWRDQKIREYRAHNKQLQAQVSRLGGRIPSRPGVDGPTGVVDPVTGIARIRSSGLFDETWYRWQLEQRGLVAEPTIEHYVHTGHTEGLSATPAVAESWYAEQAGIARLDVAPLVHYLEAGAARAPHPLFPVDQYLADHPEASDHRGGPLGHFLERGREIVIPTSTHATSPSTTVAPTLVLSPGEFLDRARAAAEHLELTRGYEHVPRMSATFDVEAEEQFKAALRADDSLIAGAPLVSVILPTKDRAAVLPAALDSVLAQTYDHWELVVVDDGSTDGTAALLAEYAARDDRVRVVRLEVNRGVAAARNAGIAVASGTYLAYLDSDNTWRPDFLELMVRFLRRERASVGYASSALVEQGGKERRQYRAQPFSRAVLRERNYIDCIVVVHEKSLLERTGGFDEGLRRTVDWDLLIRLADVTDFAFAPFIGTEYDLWEEGTDRISTDEPEGYRYRVRERTLVDWDRARREVGDRQDHASVVVHVSSGAERAIRTVRRVLEVSAPDVEVVVVDNHMQDGDSIAVHMAFTREPRVRVLRLTQRLTPELARNLGAAESRGSVLLFLPEDAWAFESWDRRLVEALATHAVVQPLMLTMDGAVWSAGVSFAHYGRGMRLFAGLATDAPETRTTRVVDGVSAVCTAVRAADFVAVEGFDALQIRHDSGAELSVRVRTHRGGTAACVGEAVVSFYEPRTERARNLLQLDIRLDNDRGQATRWASSGLTPAPTSRPGELTVTAHRVGHMLTSEPEPVYTRDRGRLRWAIKIGAYYTWERENWGDWHFALALRDSLEALGHEVTIDGREAWYRPTAYLDDVVLVLQGRGRYRPSPHQLNVVWVISHPASAPTADLTEYDLAFGASQRWCSVAACHARSTPELLLQCTDTDRFRPSAPDPAYAHDVLMVGNARGGRPIVADALEAGIVPEVYGVKWDGLVPAEAWKGRYIPNPQVPAHYANAAVVLNDHWAEMRDWGLVSNRLFDAVACGARVLSDHLPEIAEIFGDTVRTYRTPDELRAHVEELRSEGPADRERRLAAAEKVRAAHSFDARAATISARVQAALPAMDRSDH